MKLRSNSAAERTKWEAACAEFHTQFDDLFFPGGVAGWSTFLAGTPEGTQLALLFLEVDQYTFRSGYHKQIVWHRLKRLFLTADEQHRLESVAVMYLHKRVRREFWHMVRFMRLRGSPSFWEHVELLSTRGGDQPSAIKARWLLLARMNAPVRQWVGSELFHPKYQPGYVPRLDFPVPKQKANPSIERSFSSKLRLPPGAAHIER